MHGRKWRHLCGKVVSVTPDSHVVLMVPDSELNSLCVSFSWLRSLCVGEAEAHGGKETWRQDTAGSACLGCMALKRGA